MSSKFGKRRQLGSWSKEWQLRSILFGQVSDVSFRTVGAPLLYSGLIFRCRSSNVKYDCRSTQNENYGVACCDTYNFCNEDLNVTLKVWFYFC